MNAAVMLFALGVSLVVFLPLLPEFHRLVLVLVAVPLLFTAKRTLPLLGLLIGFSFVVYEGRSWIDQKIPDEQQGEIIWLEVRIVSNPESIGEKTRFRAQVRQGIYANRNLILTWLDDNPPNVGEIWLLPLKLFRPRGSVNPELFDYEAWLLSERVHGVGYVLPDSEAEKIAGSPFWRVIQRFRTDVANRLSQSVGDQAIRGALIALLIGDSSQLESDTWQHLTQTGTNHLFVVSGLHVGLVATVVWFVLGYLPLQHTTKLIIAALVLASDSIIVGFGLPVQRALFMILVASFVMAIRREVFV